MITCRHVNDLLWHLDLSLWAKQAAMSTEQSGCFGSVSVWENKQTLWTCVITRVCMCVFVCLCADDLIKCAYNLDSECICGTNTPPAEQHSWDFQPVCKYGCFLIVKFKMKLVFNSLLWLHLTSWSSTSSYWQLLLFVPGRVCCLFP